MKKWMILLFSIILVIFASGCGNAKQQSGEQNQNQNEKKKLTMATSGDYKPYEFYDTASGNNEIIGFDIDIAKYIANELNFDLEIIDMDFNGLLASLQMGKADFVMAGMSPRPDRLENADFSEIYFEAKNTIISKEGSGYHTAEDLVGKKVGVQLGSIQEDEAKEMEGIEIVALNKIPEIIQEVKSGRLDAAIVEDTVAKGYVESFPDLQFHVIPNLDIAGSAVAFPKGSELIDDFNQVIQKMKDNGELERLIIKWFEE